MRRIDVILLSLGILGGGLVVKLGLEQTGLDSLDAGVWTQAVLVLGLLGWVSTYLVRAVTHNLTFHKQFRDYEDALLQKRYNELSPEELAQLQADVEQERDAAKP
jgi:Protein of unknown function (DUF3007)